MSRNSDCLWCFLLDALRLLIRIVGPYFLKNLNWKLSGIILLPIADPLGAPRRKSTNSDSIRRHAARLLRYPRGPYSNVDLIRMKSAICLRMHILPALRTCSNREVSATARRTCSDRQASRGATARKTCGNNTANAQQTRSKHAATGAV